MRRQSDRILRGFVITEPTHSVSAFIRVHLRLIFQIDSQIHMNMCAHIFLFMATMTLSVPDDLYAVIKHHNEVKWSLIARNAMWEYARKVQILDNILEKSELTEMDADEMASLVKKNPFVNSIMRILRFDGSRCG